MVCMNVVNEWVYAILAYILMVNLFSVRCHAHATSNVYLNPFFKFEKLNKFKPYLTEPTESKLVNVNIETVFEPITDLSFCGDVIYYPFPSFMTGHVAAKFADGGSAVANFYEYYGNATFNDGEKGLIAMIQPMKKGIDPSTGTVYFVFHECVNITTSTDPVQHRCSLVVPTETGYIEHLHHEPALIPMCPTSLSEPGLELEIVTHIEGDL